MISTDTICLVGPTACHKTEISIMLAKHFDCEIISADSVSVYRDMDIGSAKPSKTEQEMVKHHLIDCVDPRDTSFSVAEYQRLARLAICDIGSRGKTPLIIGGSGLYVDAIYSDLSFAYPSDKKIRESLEKEYEDNPSKAYKKLLLIDAATADRLNPNDYKRVIRALEVYVCSGKTMSEYQSGFEAVQSNKLYSSVKIGLTMDRERLYNRIEKRVNKMFDKGLIAEVQNLVDRGVTPASPAMQAIGYRQIVGYLNGDYNLPTAKELCIKDTRHFAKRQLTWFKRDKETTWFSLDDYSTIDDAVESIISYISNKGENNAYCK